MKNKKYVHKDFYDSIEERIQDLNDFEVDINADELDSVWFGMEDLLQVDNSVHNLKNLEVNVTDDIWANIENKLVEKDRKPVVWWPYTAVAGVLLAIFSGILLNNYQNDRGLVNVPINNKMDINSSFEKDDSKSPDKTDSREFRSNKVINGHVVRKEEESSLVLNNEKNTQLLASNNSFSSKSSGDLNKDLTIQKEPILVRKKSPPMKKNGGNLNKGVISYIPVASVKEANSVSNGDKGSGIFVEHINKVSPISVMSVGKATGKENTLISHPFPEEEESEVQSKDNWKRWKLLASIGVGNYQNIEKNYEWRASAQDRKRNDKASVYRKIEVNNNEGINKQSYHIPLSVTLESQFDITENMGVRIGLTSTKLNYVYEIYNVGNEIEFYYAGIPLGIAVKIMEKGRFRGNLNSEFRVEKMISSKYIVLKGDYVLADAELDPIENFGVNTAVSLGMDLQYMITPKSILFVRPKLTKYISTDTQSFYDRNEQLVWPELNFGYGLTL